MPNIQRIETLIFGRGKCFLRLAAPALLASVAWLNLSAQQTAPKLNAEQAQILQGINGLRQLPDTARGTATLRLAQEIDALPPSLVRVELATGLAGLSTEGDPGGQPTLQAVATTLADALQATPAQPQNGAPAMSYGELASLVRYEHVTVHLQDPQLEAALAQLQHEDELRQSANFTLTDLSGHSWKLRSLRGKVVMVNFWATWCPPCRKEIPELEELQKEFGPRGLIILGVGDEKASVLRAFASSHGMNYPTLLDQGDQVHQQYGIESIPMSFVYDRAGKLVATAMDMRTGPEFRAMLASTNLR